MNRHEQWPVGDRPSVDIGVPVGFIEVRTGPAGSLEQPPASYAGRTRFTQLEYEAVLANARRLAETGAAGFSIEDYDPVTGGIDPIERAVERVAAAVEGAASTGAMVTARTENHLYGVDNLDDTVARLQAFVGAGADVLYAPGLVDLAAIARVVDEIDAPVNVLAFGRGPTVAELASVGVRRVSTGSGLARAAHGALVSAATELLEVGTFSFLSGSSTDGSFAAVPISRSRLDAAFGH